MTRADEQERDDDDDYEDNEDDDDDDDDDEVIYNKHERARRSAAQGLDSCRLKKSEKSELFPVIFPYFSFGALHQHNIHMSAIENRKLGIKITKERCLRGDKF